MYDDDDDGLDLTEREHRRACSRETAAIIVGNAVVVMLLLWLGPGHHTAPGTYSSLDQQSTAQSKVVQPASSADSDTTQQLRWALAKQSRQLDELQRQLLDVEASVSSLNTHRPVHQPSGTPPRATTTAAATVESRKHLVIGVASGLGFSWVYRFVKSLRDVAPPSRTDVVLLCVDLPQNQRDLMRDFNVSFHQYKLSEALSPELANLPPGSYRWLLIHQYLEAAQKRSRLSSSLPPYANVMFVDVRDTVFQRDPFIVMEGQPGFHAFLEAKRAPVIGKCKTNAKWVRDCYGQAVLDKIGHNTVSCSGTSIASWTDALRYTSLIVAKYQLDHQRCGDYGVDQGIHNVLVWDSQYIAADRMYRHTNEHGPIATVQSMQQLFRDKYGRVVNEDGHVVVAVHQYDRSSVLVQQLKRQYPIVPVDQRRDKGEWLHDDEDDEKPSTGFGSIAHSGSSFLPSIQPPPIPSLDFAQATSFDLKNVLPNLVSPTGGGTGPSTPPAPVAPAAPPGAPVVHIPTIH